MKMSTKLLKLVLVIYCVIELNNFVVDCKTLQPRKIDYVPGCYHNGSLFADTSIVPTEEPCLLCKCLSRSLICIRKICAEQPYPPPRGCVLVHKNGQCCPYMSCSKYHITFYKNNDRRVMQFSNSPNQLDFYSTSKDVIGKNRRSDDEEIPEENEVCIEDGTVYKSGSAMSSSSLCSYCYCINGKQKCVRPKCQLAKADCEPIFVDTSCCPIRYDCGRKKNSTHLEIPSKYNNGKFPLKNVKRTNRSNGCFVDSFYYEEGEKLPYDNKYPCDICFCIRGKKECTPKQCAPAIRGCLPKIPRGECCAIGYDCQYSQDKVISRELGVEHREEPSAGFDFLDLLFGPDDPLEDSSSELSEVYTPPAKVLTTEQTVPSPVSSTTEKSFLDILRAGLELIDANSDKIGAAIGVRNFTANQMKIGNQTNVKPAEKIVTSELPIITSQSPIKILNSITAKVPDPEKTTPEPTTTVRIATTSKKVLTDSPIKYVYITTKSHLAKNTTKRPSPTTTTTIAPITEATEKTTASSTTLKPSTTTKEIINTTQNIVSTNKSTTVKKLTTTATTIKPKTTVTTTKTTKIQKPSRINDKVLDNMDDIVIEIEPKIPSTTTTTTTSTSRPTTTTASKIKTTTQKITSPSTTTLFNTTIINSTTTTAPETTEKLKESDTKLNSKPVTTTESILSAFFSGLSSIFENSDVLKKKPNSNQKDKIQPIMESHFTPKPPVAKLPLNRNPLPNPAVLPLDKPVQIPVDDYSYDYNEPTLPSSLPNLKIIPFLPTDAVDKVNYYKPNPIPLSENLDIYGSPGSTKVNEGYLGLDYGSSFDPYNKDQYVVYSTIKDSTKDNSEVAELSITENYDEKSSVFPKLDKTKLENPNQVKFTNKYSNEKYENLDYDFNPHEKMDHYGEDIKYIPNKYESAVYSSSDYNKYGSNGVVYPTAELTQSEKYYYGDGYESVYTGNENLFSPPTKTEGGFIPKDAVKNDYFYETVTAKLGSASTTESTVKLPPIKPPFNLLKEAISKEKVPSIETVLKNSSSSEIKSSIDQKPFIVNQSNDSTIRTSTIQPILAERSTTRRTETSEPVTLSTSKLVSYYSSTKQPAKGDDFSLANVFSYLFTSDNDDDLDDNTLYTNSYQPQEVIPPFKNINITVPKWDELTSLYNVTPMFKQTTTTRSPTTYVTSSTSKYNTVQQTTKFKIPITQQQTTTTTTTTTTELPTTTLPPVTHKIAPVTMPIVQPTEKPIPKEQYIINPIDIEKMKKHHSEGVMEIHAKPTLPNINGLLKLAGCNIYGKMYRVGKIIPELSNRCLECKCTEIGVTCAQKSC